MEFQRVSQEPNKNVREENSRALSECSECKDPPILVGGSRLGWSRVGQGGQSNKALEFP